MTRITAQQLREKKAEERGTLLAEKRESLRAARFARSGAQTRDSKHIAGLRKEIARILTVETEMNTATNTTSDTK
jgi:ribosomal protein L29